jgi:hypothetical protein
MVYREQHISWSWKAIEIDRVDEVRIILIPEYQVLQFLHLHLHSLTMRSAFTSLVALSTILSPVLAAPQQPALSSTTQCATKYGPRSTQVSTQKQTSTKTVRSTATVYTTKQVVVTPRPLTITVISNVISTVFTTLSTSTGTFTSTITDTSVASTTQTQTVAVSATQVATVSLVSTTTVPASAGFTPLASSLPGAGRKKRGTRNLEARKPLLKVKWEKDGTKEQATCRAGGPKPGYAQKVDCTVIVTTTAIVSTQTSTRFTTTLAAAPTVTRTNGVTSVSTVTVLPEPARTTVTTRVGVTTTTTIQTIQTSITTTTVSDGHVVLYLPKLIYPAGN